MGVYDPTQHQYYDTDDPEYINDPFRLSSKVFKDPYNDAPAGWDAQATQTGYVWYKEKPGPSTPGPGPTPFPSPTPPPPSPTSPGIDPNQFKNQAFGKKIPISALGKGRIGGQLVCGPWGTETGVVSGGWSFGFPADPTGSRVLLEIAMDSKVAWTLADGFTGESFTFRYTEGTQTQGADALETTNFPDEPVAYRPQMMLYLEDIPMAPFGNKIPYVAATWGDTTDGADPEDGINLGEGLERIAWSPWANYTSDTFQAVNVEDVVGGIILADDWTMIQLCQYVSRMYRNLDLLQSDKIYIKDHGALVTPDFRFDRNRIIASDKPIQFVRQEPSATPRELEFVSIDPDADYTWVPAKAQRARDPINVSASVGKETITLPLIMDQFTRISMAYYAQYAEEAARKKVSVTVMAYGYEIEPGDRMALIDMGDGFDDEVFKVTRTHHGANYVVQIEAEAISRCSLLTAGGEASAVVCVHAENFSDDSCTFTSAFGDDNVNRITVVAFSMRVLAAAQTITGVTINGIAATEAVSITAATLSGGIPSCISSIWYAANPTGATGYVEVTASGAFTDLEMGVYRLVTSTSTPSDTGAAEATTASAVPITIDVPTDGFVIAAGATRQGAPFTWVGASQDCVIVNAPHVTGQRSTASYSASDVTGHTISIDPNSIDRATICAAAWTLT
jgi:Putative phage tail protein